MCVGSSYRHSTMREGRGASRPTANSSATRSRYGSFASGNALKKSRKMLGHVNTDMVRKHYAPWVEEMDQTHIRRVVKSWIS